MGFGAEIEAYIDAEKPKTPGPELVKAATLKSLQK
jgi:hypothetical protein